MTKRETRNPVVINFNKIKAVSILVFKTFMGQPLGPLMALVSPVVVFISIPYLFNGVSNIPMKATLHQIVPGLLTMPALMISILGIPITFASLKETGILKKFNVAGLRPWIFIFSIVFVFFSIILIATLSIYFLGWIIWRDDLPAPHSGKIILSYSLLLLISTLIGLNIGNIAKSQAIAFAMGILMFMLTFLLGGVMFSRMTGWLNVASHMVPQSSYAELFKNSWYADTLNIAPYQDGSIKAMSDITDQDITNILKPLTDGAANSGINLNAIALDGGSDKQIVTLVSQLGLSMPVAVVDPGLFGTVSDNTTFAYLYPGLASGILTGVLVWKFKWE